jgi:hypothetical protein
LELADGEFQPEVEDEGKEEELSSEMVEKIKTTRESELQMRPCDIENKTEAGAQSWLKEKGGVQIRSMLQKALELKQMKNLDHAKGNSFSIL